MKFLNYLNEWFLTNQVSFGFELEAFRKYATDKELEDNNIDSTGWAGDDTWDLIKKEIGEFFPNGDIKEDNSINSPDEYTDFEWTSPILDFTLENISKLKKFFLWFKNNKNYNTNASCGLHFHFSFPEWKAEDAFWIVCQFAMDENALKIITYLDEIKFFNKFAKIDYLKKLKKKINDKNWNSVFDFFNNEKYHILKIHEMGTLEWRGPRNFLNKSKDIELINEFIEKLFKFVLLMIKKLDIKELNGLSKQEFYSKIEYWKEMYSQRDMEFTTKENIDKSSKTLDLSEEQRKLISYKWPWFNKLNFIEIGVEQKSIRTKKLNIYSTGSRSQIVGNEKVIIENCFFESIKLKNVKMKDCELEECEVSENSEILRCDLSYTNTENSKLISCNISDGTLNYSEVINCVTDGSDFTNSKIDGGKHNQILLYMSNILSGVFSDVSVENSIWNGGIFKDGSFNKNSKWILGTWKIGNIIFDDWKFNDIKIDPNKFLDILNKILKERNLKRLKKISSKEFEEIKNLLKKEMRKVKD